MDSKEERQTAPPFDSFNSGSRGSDGCTSRCRTDIRGRSPATTIWVSKRTGRKNGCTTSIFSYPKTRTTRDRGRRSAGLLHDNPARADDAMRDKTHRGWPSAICNTTLAQSSDRGKGEIHVESERGGARECDFTDDVKSLFPAISSRVVYAGNARAPGRLRRQLCG